MLTVKGLGMRFGQKEIFSDVSFALKKNDRMMVVGPNGCGKSTLIKLILDKLTPVSGKIEAGYNVKVGYYDQENQNLDPENAVIDELWDAYPQKTETEIRNALALFRFVGDDVFKPVAVLSGVALALNHKFNLYLSGIMPSAVFFPLVNGVQLIAATLVSLFLFRERLSVKQWIGMAIGAVAVIVLCNPFGAPEFLFLPKFGA